MPKIKDAKLCANGYKGATSLGIHQYSRDGKIEHSPIVWGNKPEVELLRNLEGNPFWIDDLRYERGGYENWPKAHERLFIILITVADGTRWRITVDTGFNGYVYLYGWDEQDCTDPFVTDETNLPAKCHGCATWMITETQWDTFLKSFPHRRPVPPPPPPYNPPPQLPRKSKLPDFLERVAILILKAGIQILKWLQLPFRRNR